MWFMYFYLCWVQQRAPFGCLKRESTPYQLDCRGDAEKKELSKHKQEPSLAANKKQLQRIPVSAQRERPNSGILSEPKRSSS